MLHLVTGDTIIIFDVNGYSNPLSGYKWIQKWNVCGIYMYIVPYK